MIKKRGKSLIELLFWDITIVGLLFGIISIVLIISKLTGNPSKSLIFYDIMTYGAIILELLSVPFLLGKIAEEDKQLRRIADIVTILLVIIAIIFLIGLF